MLYICVRCKLNCLRLHVGTFENCVSSSVDLRRARFFWWVFRKKIRRFRCACSLHARQRAWSVPLRSFYYQLEAEDTNLEHKTVV